MSDVDDELCSVCGQRRRVEGGRGCAHRLEPTVIPRKTWDPGRPGTIFATEKIVEGGYVIYAPGDVVPFDDAVRLGLVEPPPPPPEPVTTEEKVRAWRIAAQAAARRRRVIRVIR